MKKQIYRIILLILSLVFFNNCVTEPEDPPPPPPLMEWIVGTYHSPFAKLANISYNKNSIEIDSRSNLIIKSDYTYSLFFKGYSHFMDSTIVIIRYGTFRIPSYKWDEISGWSKTAKGMYYWTGYVGTIWFYPENYLYQLGGEFHSSKNCLCLDFRPKLSTEDGVEIEFSYWKK